MANLRFKTVETRKKQTKRKTLALLLVLLVIVIVASLITFFKERGDTGSDEPTTEAEITLASENNLKDEVNILVAGVTTNENTIEFMLVLHFDTADEEVSVAGVKAPSGVDASKPTDLVAAVKKSSGIDIDRYVILNQKKFKAFIKCLGSYEINLKENLNYSSDEFSINLLKGKQTLAGEKLYNYLRYLYIGGSDYALEKTSAAVADYISQVYTEEKTAKGQDLFEDLVNSCETDISIVDYTKYENFLVELSKKSTKINSVNIDDLETKR